LRPLAWTRIAFAAVLLIRTTPLMRAIDPRIGGDVHGLLGWPDATSFHATALGFALPRTAVELLCGLRTVAALLLVLGYRPLLTGLLTGAAGYLIVLQDAFAFTFTKHLLFLGAAVIGTTDCAAVLSVRPEAPRAPRTSLVLVRAFSTSIYFWAAFGKLRRDWLDGRTLELFHAEGKLSGALADWLLGTAARRAAAGTAVVLTELALVPLLWWRRTRWLGLAAALGLHVTIEEMARPDVLGWAMIALLLSFVPARDERRVTNRESDGRAQLPPQSA
jgi:hypothetical protein